MFWLNRCVLEILSIDIKKRFLHFFYYFFIKTRLLKLLIFFNVFYFLVATIFNSIMLAKLLHKTSFKSHGFNIATTGNSPMKSQRRVFLTFCSWRQRFLEAVHKVRHTIFGQF